MLSAAIVGAVKLLTLKITFSIPETIGVAVTEPLVAIVSVSLSVDDESTITSVEPKVEPEEAIVPLMVSLPAVPCTVSALVVSVIASYS